MPCWLARQLRIALPASDVALPDEIDNLRDRLVPLRPGVWALRESASAPAAASPVPGVPLMPAVFALVELHNTGDRALALGTFTLDLVPEQATAPATPSAWSMACDTQRYQPRAPVPPGRTLSYLCRGPELPSALQDAGTALSAAQQQGRLRIRSDALDSESGRSAIVAALAQPQEDTLRSFLTAHASCGPRGTCTTGARTPRPRTDMAPAPGPVHKRSSGQILKSWMALLAGAASYFVVARYVSIWLASLALFLVLVVPSVQLFQSARALGTTGWGGLAAVPLMMGAVVMPLAVPAAAARLYRIAMDREERRR